MSDRSVTELLRDWSAGDPEALERLTPLIYTELRRQAGAYFRNERPGHTLQPTALVNEAFLRLGADRIPGFESRSHFFAIAATVMRQVLVDHARRKSAEKRAPERDAVPLESIDVAAGSTHGIEELDDALRALERVDPRKARVLELRYFSGLGELETAETLGVSDRTVRRDARLAEAWLRRYMAGEDPDAPR